MKRILYSICVCVSLSTMLCSCNKSAEEISTDTVDVKIINEDSIPSSKSTKLYNTVLGNDINSSTIQWENNKGEINEGSYCLWSGHIYVPLSNLTYLVDYVTEPKVENLDTRIDYNFIFKDEDKQSMSKDKLKRTICALNLSIPKLDGELSVPHIYNLLEGANSGYYFKDDYILVKDDDYWIDLQVLHNISPTPFEVVSENDTLKIRDNALSSKEDITDEVLHDLSKNDYLWSDTICGKEYNLYYSMRDTDYALLFENIYDYIQKETEPTELYKAEATRYLFGEVSSNGYERKARDIEDLWKKDTLYIRSLHEDIERGKSPTEAVIDVFSRQASRTLPLNMYERLKEINPNTTYKVEKVIKDFTTNYNNFNFEKNEDYIQIIMKDVSQKAKDISYTDALRDAVKDYLARRSGIVKIDDTKNI